MFFYHVRELIDIPYTGLATAAKGNTEKWVSKPAACSTII